MSLSDSELLEIATLVRERLTAACLARYRELAATLDPLKEHAKHLRSICRRLRLCAHKHRFSPAGQATRQLRDRLRWLASDTARASDSAAGRFDHHAPSAAGLISDLRQAEREFDRLRYDPQEKLLAAATEPIELEGVLLGEFEIQLELGSETPCGPQEMFHFSIVALAARPAAVDDRVTHPHVRHEELCAGNAEASIRSALAQGRLCDFFLLVRSVLTNYNASSAYVSLSDWQGDPCYDCGRNMASGDGCGCAGCEHDFCEECISACSQCETRYCSECLDECAICGDKLCSACLTPCPDCKRPLCKTCLEENHCPCHQEKENDHEAIDTAAQAAATN
jgi:hypothetical protein